MRPGKRTAEYIDRTLTRLTFVGAIYLSFVVILPDYMIRYLNVPFYFGGTGLLIGRRRGYGHDAANESHLRHATYESFLKKGSLARTSVGAMVVEMRVEEECRWRLIFLGPPAAGKGTQAKRLAAECGIPHISTGDILRQLVRGEPTLGEKRSDTWIAAPLVPDDVMIGIIQERLQQSDCAPGFILDGFPSHHPQRSRSLNS